MLSRYLLIILIFIINTAQAGIIRDSEIEEAVNKIVDPLRKASKLNNLKIYIIDEQEPNAFTAGGNIIFVTSGLIIDYPDPDVLRGILAHEIGHIIGKHLVRRDEVLENYKKAAIGTAALGLATAMSGGAAEGLAVTIGGFHMSERSVYAYSRELESSADQSAIKILEKSGHSAIGMLKFFEKMKIQNFDGSDNVYDLTHPLNSERISVIRQAVNRSKYPTSQNQDDIITKYARSSAKLAAFTLEPKQVSNYKIKSGIKEELKRYIEAISCFRLGNFDDALNNINFLIMKHPDDPFYHELKAQIYFEAGKSAALHEYELAEEKRPQDPLIRLGKAIVGITKYMDNSQFMARYYKDLLFVLEKEPDNLLALYYCAIYYEKNGQIGKGHLNTAIIALNTGRIADARKMASMAMKELPNRSPDWYKASDIVEATKE